MADKEKAKGVCTAIEKKTSAAGKDYYFATIGGVKMLFFDSKIMEFKDKEIEVEYTVKTDEKGTTFFGTFPGQSKSSSAAPRRGTAPEELKQKAIDMKLRTKTMIFSYAKDMVISGRAGKPFTAAEVIPEFMEYIKTMLTDVANNIKELE